MLTIKDDFQQCCPGDSNDVHTQYEYNRIQHLLKSLKLSKEYMEPLKDREAKLSDEIVPRLDEVIKVLGHASLFLLDHNYVGFAVGHQNDTILKNLCFSNKL